MAHGAIILLIFLGLIGFASWFAYRGSVQHQLQENLKPLRNKLTKRLDSFRREIAPLQELCELLKRHTFDYQNSLGPSGLEKLHISESLIQSVVNAMEEASSEIQKSTLESTLKAQKIITGALLSGDWKESIETRLQTLGQLIGIAALDMRGVGSKGFSLTSPTDTLDDLRAAGFDIPDKIAEGFH